MLGRVIHIGVTVSNLERSIDFYKNTLGLSFQGQMIMEGEATDKLFNMKNVSVKVAYLNSTDNLQSPPIELLEFSNIKTISSKQELNKISVSEICFLVKDINDIYNKLKNKGVEFISEPQYFDLSEQGFGKSKAVYFKDPDGIILELLEYID